MVNFIWSSCFLLLAGFALHLPAEIDASTEYNRYLAHIFQKYGNGGTMTFEGLEHLMYSLGLGQIEFDPKHTLEAHYPPDAQSQSTTKESELKTYFEEQTTKLSEENDVQMAAGNQQHKQTAEDLEKLAEKQTKVTNDDEKGFVLEFKELHDPKHRHPRENTPVYAESPISSNVCLSPKSLLRLVVDHDDLHKRKLYKTIPSFSKPSSTLDSHNTEEEYNEFINSVRLTPVAFMKLCPALLAQIDQHVCVKPAPLTNGEDPKQQLWNAWIYASISIFILSACGLLGVLLVPLMKTVAYQEILKFLVAVAVGTLAGDALMHLLPHALVKEPTTGKELMLDAGGNAEEAHGHDNSAVWICGCSFATAVFMYILEHVLPLLKGDNDADHHGHGHSHAHGHKHHTVNEKEKQPTKINDAAPKIDFKEALEINIMLDELKKDKKQPSRPLTPLAFMVIIGDALHNLTDGLAIGAAFASDPVTGMATAFAVLCHELPHELGDFALLLQTGVSIKRAVCLNIVSSVLSFVGMAAGLLIAGVHSGMTQWIYACTAGSFLYIAFADLMPAMSADSEPGKKSLKSTLIEVMGISAGGIIMLLIAVNEHDLEVLFK